MTTRTHKAIQPATPTHRNRAVIYLRVSGQYDEREASLKTQEAKCREEATKRGLTVVHVFQEKHTGTELTERKVMSEARRMIRNGEVDFLIVYSVDRLARKQEHVFIIYEELKKLGGELVCWKEPFENTAIGKLILSIHAFRAESEVEYIRDRTMRGRNDKLDRGVLTAATGALFGYRFITESKGTKTIHTGRRRIERNDAATVKHIFHLVADRGMSARRAAQELNTNLTLYPTPAVALGRKKQGTKWSGSTVRAIIRNRTYLGETRAQIHKKDPNTKRLVKRPEEEVRVLPEGVTPQIVDPETWAKANEVLDGKSRNFTLNEKDFVLLRGFVFCKRCNHKHIVCYSKRDGVKHHKFRCNSRNHNSEDWCGAPTVSATWLAANVWAELCEWAKDPERVQAAAVAQERALTDCDRMEETRAVLAARLAEIERQRSRAVQTMVSAHDDDKGLFEQQLHLLRENKATIEKALAEVEVQIAACSSTAIDAVTWQQIAELFARGAEKMPDEVRREAIEALRLRVVTDGRDFNLELPNVGVLVTETNRRSDHKYTPYIRLPRLLNH